MKRSSHKWELERQEAVAWNNYKKLCICAAEPSTTLRNDEYRAQQKLWHLKNNIPDWGHLGVSVSCASVFGSGHDKLRSW